MNNKNLKHNYNYKYNIITLINNVVIKYKIYNKMKEY